jgi:hypothetical protein
VRWETKERGEEEHLQGRGRVDSPAEPNAHVLLMSSTLGIEDLGPGTKDGWAGWRGEGNGGWEDGRIGAAVGVVVRGQRSQVV